MQLQWMLKEDVFVLQGSLTQNTFLSLWQAKQKAGLGGYTAVDVAALSHVDTAGLALLIDLLNPRQSPPIVLKGASEKLNMLIELYNLRQVIHNES